MQDREQDPAARTRASCDAIAERFRERTHDRARVPDALRELAARCGNPAPYTHQ